MNINKGQYLLDDVSDSVVVLSYRTEVCVRGMWLCLRKISLTYSTLSEEYFGIRIRLTAGSARMSSHSSLSSLFSPRFPYFSATIVSSLLDLIKKILIEHRQEIIWNWPYPDDLRRWTFCASGEARWGWSWRRFRSRSFPPEIILVRIHWFDIAIFIFNVVVRRRIRINGAVEEFKTTRDTPVCSIV